MARLPYWLLQGVLNLQTDPLHARIYYDPQLPNKNYIHEAVNARSDPINLGGSRVLTFSDPAGDGSGPGWRLSYPGNPTSFLFTNYNISQLGNHVVAVYNATNHVIIATVNLGSASQSPRIDSYARIVHLDPFIQMQESGGSDKHSYHAIATAMLKGINWPADAYTCALLDDSFVINRQSVKYTALMSDIPSSAVKATAPVHGKFVNEYGLAISLEIKFEGIPAGTRLYSQALYKTATGEIVTLQIMANGGITTSGTEPVWVTPQRFTIGQ